ncbi:COX15/CtaA family protein [Arachidicoccus terrestris]|uniref:COX15/CtaA family protein n=1 Tax=Arachidicoccus terrestris TaxID=2875539 RepID=UPI001CC5A80A|nr:COX15/CtaA family protein [Arachidicoccus terrestris]UAY56996.1 COX15/CtaA family protein [Arachidicoccus terrestris]
MRSAAENQQRFIKYAKLVLYTIFIVILAGSIVRTTHSGMGCPDWPHCFGRWIPPLNAGQLPPDFEKYLKKQDIDHTFNAFHTWIEYLNRMLTVLLGIFIVLLNFMAWKIYRKTRPAIFIWALSLFVLVGFEAWVGKVVVNSNLGVLLITAHMIPALIIAGVCVYMIHLVHGKPFIINKPLKWLTWLAFVLVFIQILIGTEVRAEVDHVSKALRYTARETWLSQVGDALHIHELFAWVASLSCIFVVGKSFNHKETQKIGLLVLISLVAELFLGLIMTQMQMPAFAQPLHLLFSSIIIVALFSLLLRARIS